MAILNLTPDSFSRDGIAYDCVSAIATAERLIIEGADIIDAGAESTRPGARQVPLEEELYRIGPVARELARLAIPFSVDTTKYEVAEYCLDLGAKILNSIDAHESLFLLAKRYSVPCVIMHMRGTPETMVNEARYSDCTLEVKSYLRERIEYARSIGADNLIVDPGFGFAKTGAHNRELLANLASFKELGCPLLVGLSRKRTFPSLCDTLDANTIALHNGADIIRVHDVSEHRAVIDAVHSSRTCH